MREWPNPLPSSCGLDIGAFSRLFNDTTNSYKHLFFDALLTEFREKNFKASCFSLEDLSIGMLAAAWHPVRVYRLSLGVRDQATILLSHVQFGEDGPIPSRRLKAALKAQNIDGRSLMRWVPYRLIAPFFVQQLRGVTDSYRNSLIRSLAEDSFGATRPLYKFADADTIELHPDWAAYLADNFPIVSGWAERRWIAYLQAHNPTVPAVSEKTGPPSQRTALTAQTRYWKKVIGAMAEVPRCIYSGVQLDPKRFHLDHFLPWTFVCHDALWNLLPVSPEANSSKSNRLPHPLYLPAFAAAQSAGLLTAHRTLSKGEWEAAASPFIGDLRVPEARLLDPTFLAEAYGHSVGAQLDIARAIGFEAGWQFGL